MMRRKNLLLVIIGLSVILRMAAAVWFGDQVTNLPGTYDQISYHTLALRVLDGHDFTFGEVWWPITAANAPTSHWSFLYTFYLMAVYTLFGPHPLAARILQAVLVGVLQPLLAYLVGRRLFNENVGLLSGFLMAIYAYFVYYAASLMTESFYITAILAVIYGSIRLVDLAAASTPAAQPAPNWQALLRAGLLLGIVLGITVLLRQVFLMFIPFLFLWIWWASRKHSFGKVFGATVLAGVVVVLMILPFTIFNYARFHRFVLLNTNAGYAFYLANHPIYGTHFESILPPEMGSYQELIPANLRSLDEAALDQELLKEGLQFVVDDPVRYVLLSISRVPALFMFWPSPESGLLSNVSRVASFGLFLPFMLYGLALALLSKKYAVGLESPVFLVILFVAFYASIHILSWSLIRYRLPIDAVMLAFAALGLADLYARVKEWLAPTPRQGRMMRQA